MSGLKKVPLISLVGASGTLLFSLIPALASGQTVKPNVTVVNTAANPVPVTGTITSNVSGTVNASQSGTWNVGITGTPTVAISGSVTTHPEEQPADTAVQFNLFDDCDSDTYTVPAGNRLVIEYVSSYATGFAGNENAALIMHIVTHVNGSVVSQILPMSREVIDNGGNPFVLLQGGAPMVAYADSGTDVCWNTAFLSGGPISIKGINFTGHLVAQP
jgi:hypothetical protein